MIERDERGHFKKGVSANPKGRPPMPKEEKFYKATLAAVSLSDWRDIVKKAVELAKRGNPAARRWLADYLMGPPQQKMDITTAGEPIKYNLTWGNDIGES